MKNIFIAVSILAAFFILTPTAFGQTADANETASSQAEGSTTVVMTVANVEGTTDNFEYDCSPNVGVDILAGSTAFALTSANALLGADKETGSEYGVLSVSPGYAMRDKTTDVGVAAEAPTSTDALPGGSWAWMGGSGS